MSKEMQKDIKQVPFIENLKCNLEDKVNNKNYGYLRRLRVEVSREGSREEVKSKLGMILFCIRGRTLYKW